MTAEQHIDAYINEFTDWRGEMLAYLRKRVHKAAPQIVEEWKWGVPVFSHGKQVLAISAFKEHVKINFFQGAKLSDPHKLINNGFDSKQHRSIDFREGDSVDEKKLMELISEAVRLNIHKK